MISMSGQYNIEKLQNKLVGRFFFTPLSFCKDGSTTTKDTGQESMTAKIHTLQRVKRKIKANILYEQHNGNDITLCKIEVNTIRDMLLPLEFHYGRPLTMFDLEFEESESDSNITDFVSDDDSATEEVIYEPTTKKKAKRKRKRKTSNFNDDVSVETVGSEPSIVDNSNDLDDESDKEEE